jgi:type I restriction enzyme, S subunit
LTVFKYSAQPGIYLDDVGRLPVVKPPHEEQVAIAAWLDAETAKLDALAQKVESAIDRLKEYRTALITAATTGKIDVHNVKIPQPAA